MRLTLRALSNLAEMGVRIEIRKAPGPFNLTEITLSAGERHYRRYIDRDDFGKYAQCSEEYEEALYDELEDAALKLLGQEAKQ